MMLNFIIYTCTPNKFLANANYCVDCNISCDVHSKSCVHSIM